MELLVDTRTEILQNFVPKNPGGSSRQEGKDGGMGGKVMFWKGRIDFSGWVRKVPQSA